MIIPELAVFKERLMRVAGYSESYKTSYVPSIKRRFLEQTLYGFPFRRSSAESVHSLLALAGDVNEYFNLNVAPVLTPIKRAKAKTTKKE